MWSLKNKQGGQTGSGLTASTKFFKSQHLNSDFILGAIDDGVMVIDKSNIVNVFNKAAGTITGWAPAEAIGRNFYDVLQLVDNQGTPLEPQQNPITQALIQAKPIKNSDSIFKSKNGKEVAISIIISPILDAKGQPGNAVVAVFRDISIEKAQEQQRSDFISTASHEMRTPITAIEGYLALALNEKTATIDANARNYLTKAQDATKHLGQLFADLLTSSKAEDGRLSSNPVVVELGEIVAQVTEAEQFHAQEKRLELKYMVSGNNEVAGGRVVRPLFYTFVDPTRMTEVIQNLIDNAIKYSNEGVITVKLTGDSSIVQIQISDSGIGIPSEDIPHLFQKFYRVDNSATRTIGGTGLGLYICKRIVELYEGRIWVESNLGKGSTFFINLPRLTTEQALDKQKTQASVVTPSVMR